MTSDRPLNVAVIGAGAIGINHLQGFAKHPRVRIAGLAESHPERLAEAGRQFAIPALYTDYRELLANPEIDVVSIALPNFLHASVAIESLQAGKHVMLDKPMATQASEAEAILAAAAASGKVFMVGQNQRFSPPAQTVKALVTRGDLGEVYHAKAVWLRRSGIPRIGSWFTQKQFAGGGATYDIGVHSLDLALHLIGDFDAVAVSGQTYAKFGPRGLGGGSWGRSEVDTTKPFDVDDFAIALIKLRSGRSVSLEASWARHQEVGDVNGVHVFGTEATASTNPLQLMHNTERGYVIEQLQPFPTPVNPERMVHFIDCVLGGTTPYVVPTESLAVQRILDALYESSATGFEVRL